MIDTEIKKVLKKARSLIRDRSNWCRGTLFENDQRVSCKMDEAVRFCATGAIKKACADAEMVDYYQVRLVLEESTKWLYNKDIVPLNDGSKKKKAHKRILKAYKHAIKGLP